MSKLGIMDFEKKGNVVRFYIGDVGQDYTGDDWDDAPYEHNAGLVSAPIFDTIDVAFPFHVQVLEPADDWRYEGNSPYCKNDFKEGKVPCIVVAQGDDDRSFEEMAADDSVLKYWFGGYENLKLYRI